jgi:hypothetical protein
MTIDAIEISLYKALKAAGIVDMGSHESDLYVPVTPESTAILAKYPLQKSNTTTFKSNITGARTYDIPFAYDPFWEGKARAGQAAQPKKENVAPIVDARPKPEDKFVPSRAAKCPSNRR